MKKIHLDTDIGGDMDDMCALAMIARWPDLEITGVTTVSDDGGRRAGYAAYVLKLAGRTGVPVAAGADVSLECYRFKPGYPDEQADWPEPVARLPGSLDDALALLKRSIEAGAALVAAGPYTNFALLDQKYPGILKDADLYLMGGRIYDPPPGYPSWANDFDYNIQLDIGSAQYVLEHGHPTLIPLAMSCQTALRQAYLPALAQAGRLGQLIVRQAEACAKEYHNETEYGERFPGLPKDIINFQHDPLACAIALGWRDGVTIETVPLRFEVRDGALYEIPDAHCIPTRVVTAIDGNAFNAYWRDIICG
ncbi:MAG TPA: nucleoside hydrolase [Aggregatilineales bacterium]|nr:nucleoside hydrolase [Aggregatilineales bacterium]